MKEYIYLFSSDLKSNIVKIPISKVTFLKTFLKEITCTEPFRSNISFTQNNDVKQMVSKTLLFRQSLLLKTTTRVLMVMC